MSPQPVFIDTRPSTPETDPLNADLDLAEFSKDYSTPEGFVVFDCTIPDHHRYGRKFVTPDGTLRYPHYIKFAISHINHRHYVYGARDDINNARTTYGWPLQARAFIGPSPSGNHAVDPEVLVGDEEQQVRVDIALLELQDKGVAADVDLYHQLVPQEESIRLHEVELKREKELWAICHQEVRDHLRHSRVMERLHPYLAGSATNPLTPHHTPTSPLTSPPSCAYSTTYALPTCPNSMTNLIKAIAPTAAPFLTPSAAANASSSTLTTSISSALPCRTASGVARGATRTKTVPTPTQSATTGRAAMCLTLTRMEGGIAPSMTKVRTTTSGMATTVELTMMWTGSPSTAKQTHGSVHVRKGVMS